jgi:hypothetical protein
MVPPGLKGQLAKREKGKKKATPEHFATIANLRFSK